VWANAITALSRVGSECIASRISGI
jgi:hypothetical protein